MPYPFNKPRDHDFATNARRIVEQTIGEHLDGTPLEDPNAGKNPAAVALGKLGAKGGAASAATAPPPRRRKAIAKRRRHLRSQTYLRVLRGDVD